MAYQLYLDKAENFECDVAVKNASLKDAFARIIVESNGVSFMFPGVLKNGKCQVPIKRLKGLLEENASGKIHLEVIVEDTYFKPWEDKFQVEQHTAVKVKIQEQKTPSKPIVEVKTINGHPNPSNAVTDIVFICERMGITKENIGKRKTDFKQVIREYFKANPSRQNIRVISDAAHALK